MVRLVSVQKWTVTIFLLPFTGLAAVRLLLYIPVSSTHRIKIETMFRKVLYKHPVRGATEQNSYTIAYRTRPPLAFNGPPISF